MKSRLIQIISGLVLSAISPVVFAQATALAQPLTLTTSLRASGITIPSDFLGLSFETADTLPNNAGHYPYFRSSNRALVTLFRTIGVKSLRIGGNTSDRPGVPVPDTHDIDELFHFAQAAHVKVIYTLRLRDSSPAKDAPLAHYLETHYASDVSCLVVGNEPDVYEKQYSRYRDDLRRYLAAILAPGVAPHAMICGPSTTPGHPDWSNHFVTDFGSDGHVLWITQHSYPGGNGKKITDPAAQRDRILSPAFATHYKKLADSFVPAVEAAHLQYRIEETNSFYNGGAKDVSNTFASSLWALNYLYWWAAHHSQGVNFHTGDFVAAGPVQTICWYGIFHTMPDGRYQIRPIAYAMKAFDLTSHGTLLPVRGISSDSEIHAYAVADHVDDALYFTLVDAEHGAGARPVTVTLNPQTTYAHAAFMTLQAADGNLAATGGVRLGGAAIQSDGSWHGHWSALHLHHGRLTVTLPPATALLIRVPLRVPLA